ncbi:unnamed protein product, partial [Laminaria digitata]
ATVAATTTSILTVGGVAAATGGALLASTGGTSAVLQSASMAQSATSSMPGSATLRAPSATMALVLMGQMQFLATLSLVDSTGAEDSWILEFAKHLRWVNMWLPADIVEALTPIRATRRLQEEHHSSRCELAAAESNDIGAIGFIGNLVLFAGILLTIFLLHVLLASGVEAYWLTKVKPPTRMPLPYFDSTAEPVPQGSRRSQQVPSPSGSVLCTWSRGNEQRTGDEELGGYDTTRTEDRLKMVSACRDRSTSAWFHFPHVELLFLLFAFEGAVAAGVSALRESRCPWVIVVAAAALLLYPVLMFVMVCRTIVLRVRSDDLIVFEPTVDPDNPKDGLDYKDSFFSKVVGSWKESRSLTAWADAGQWVTVEKFHRESRPEGD